MEFEQFFEWWKGLTVIMLSWKRVNNVMELLKKYSAMTAVTHLIVVNNNPEVRLGSVAGLASGKVTLIDSSSDLGLVSRFAAAGLSRTKLVMFVDDDIELPEKTVRELFTYWAVGYESNNGAIGVAGLFGRNLSPGGAYNINNVHGCCDIALTRAVIALRTVALEACENTLRMSSDLPGGVPRDNGEDIVLSYTALVETGQVNSSRKSNRAVDLPYKNRGYDDANAISVRFRGHEAWRTQVAFWCEKNIAKTKS